jgi:hypothetical protein
MKKIINLDQKVLIIYRIKLKKKIKIFYKIQMIINKLINKTINKNLLKNKIKPITLIMIPILLVNHQFLTIIQILMIG